MTIRENTYGEAQHANYQRPLRKIKGEDAQSLWIVMACRDNEFDAEFFHWDGANLISNHDGPFTFGYGELWKFLCDAALCRAKYWLIGWRVRYAMEKAGFTEALASGQVQLPEVKAGKNKGKASGKLSYARRILEVDLVCGNNQIKMLDWQNFGVVPLGDASYLEGVTIETAEETLREYLRVTSSVGVQVSKTTSAQLGWQFYRRHVPQKNLMCNLDPQSRQLERAAYHGGRNEAFFLGDVPGTTYSLDVKSCYATICRDELMPYRLEAEYRHGLDVEKVGLTGKFSWIAEVILETNEPDYPLSWAGTPIYPVGQFRTALCWPELRHALERGRVVRVLRAAQYSAGPVFKRYAEWYLKAREDKELAKSPLGLGWLKALFNASLGYTAREKYEWVPWSCEIGFPYWFGTTASPDDRQTPVSAQVLDGERRWLRVAGEPRESMPFLHATISSYARVRLLEIFEAAGRENILYCDTDGILVNRCGYDELVTEESMSPRRRFGLVTRFAPGSARIQGQKSYMIGDNYIQAGVVKTRYSGLVEKRVLTTDTGRPDGAGHVHPFRFRCEDQGDGEHRWVNELE